MGTYLRVEISFVNGINQTNHSTNQERPCTTTQWIEKEDSAAARPPHPPQDGSNWRQASAVSVQAAAADLDFLTKG